MKDSTKVIYHKLARYCSFQDRCLQEVREKIAKCGLQTPSEVQIVIKQLEKEGYLDEQRFAEMFARGKFYSSNWGKIKISMHLRKKGINEAHIAKGLAEIDEADYQATLIKLAKKKSKRLKSDLKEIEANQKLRQFLFNKGYETNLINELLIGQSITLQQ